MVNFFKEATRLINEFWQCFFETIGIGDVTRYASYLFKSSSKKINIQFSNNTLRHYKPKNADEYLAFIKLYTQKILFNKELTFDDIEQPKLLIIDRNSFYASTLDPDTSEHFKKVFSSNAYVINEPYIVVNTKVRDFYSETYKNIKDRF